MLSCAFELELEPRYLTLESLGILEDIVVVFGCGRVNCHYFGCREEKSCKRLLRVVWVERVVDLGYSYDAWRQKTQMKADLSNVSHFKYIWRISPQLETVWTRRLHKVRCINRTNQTKSFLRSCSSLTWLLTMSMHFWTSFQVRNSWPLARVSSRCWISMSAYLKEKSPTH